MPELILRPIELHWITGNADPVPFDLCAHGRVAFSVGSVDLVDASAQPVTVSAAALFLMRTLEQPRTLGSDEWLFPCCGHAIYDMDGPDVCILGCNDGIDFAIATNLGRTTIRTATGAVHEVSEAAWRAAVFGFADEVAAFYEASSPKVPSDDVERRGFAKFLHEWERRRGRPFPLPDP